MDSVTCSGLGIKIVFLQGAYDQNGTTAGYFAVGV